MADKPEKAKKPIFKRWWFWAIIIVVAIAALGSGGDDKEDSAADPVSSAAVSTAPAPTPTPEPTQTPEPTGEASIAPETDSPAVSLDALCSLIEPVIAQNYSDCSVTHDDQMIVVNVCVDGLALELTLAQQSGTDDYKEAWETAKTNTVGLAKSICDLIDTAGQDDVYLTLNVLNDINRDNVLLTILEDIVIYDAMAQ